MADESPQQSSAEEELKKGTVRIDLPPGLGARTGAAPPQNPATTKVKPATPAPSPEDESKRETSVLGTPAGVPKPKKDTSRVQVSPARPAPPESGRPVVRLKHDEPAVAPSAPILASGPAAPARSAAGTGPSGADVGLAIGALVFSVAVLVYLAIVAMG